LFAHYNKTQFTKHARDILTKHNILTYLLHANIKYHTAFFTFNWLQLLVTGLARHSSSKLATTEEFLTARQVPSLWCLA